ncbi:MAG: 2-amino-4-hydroxy-6-hydroxymethyldihydropteridine diphosphokinase [Candidatus Kapaibacterium sp.]
MASHNSPHTTFVLLSLGANLGDRHAALRMAVELLQSNHILTDIIMSSVYETEPVGYKEQPAFLNCAVSGVTMLSAAEFHSATKHIEREIGRLRREKWHEREIDIDILTFGAEVHDTDVLHIPHPRMMERKFVLVPTAEIAPEVKHPIMQATMSELLAACVDTAEVFLYEQDRYV